MQSAQKSFPLQSSARTAHGYRKKPHRPTRGQRRGGRLFAVESVTSELLWKRFQHPTASSFKHKFQNALARSLLWVLGRERRQHRHCELCLPIFQLETVSCVWVMVNECILTISKSLQGQCWIGVRDIFRCVERSGGFKSWSTLNIVIFNTLFCNLVDFTPTVKLKCFHVCCQNERRTSCVRVSCIHSP